jgi:hypothetical protein
MQPITPSGMSNQDQLNKSFNKVLSGNTSPGNGLTFDVNGEPLTFSTDNMTGVIIRIGSLANPNALPAHWLGNNIDLTIAHNLKKVPYGIILLYATTAAIVFFGTLAATNTTITLQTTNDSTDTVIWILV